jgi:hypothetical protein
MIKQIPKLGDFHHPRFEPASPGDRYPISSTTKVQKNDNSILFFDNQVISQKDKEPKVGRKKRSTGWKEMEIDNGG